MRMRNASPCRTSATASRRTDRLEPERPGYLREHGGRSSDARDRPLPGRWNGPDLAQPETERKSTLSSHADDLAVDALEPLALVGPKLLPTAAHAPTR